MMRSKAATAALVVLFAALGVALALTARVLFVRYQCPEYWQSTRSGVVHRPVCRYYRQAPGRVVYSPTLGRHCRYCWPDR